MNNSNDLIRRVQNKLWFTPVYDGDEKRVEKIREIKSVLSMLDSYDDLVSHINDYIDSGNSFDSELFFLFHSIYTLDRPEKYYKEFRRSVFSNDRLVGGKGEKIDKFISSITYEFADIIR